MKKVILFLLIIPAFTANAQSLKTWRLGVQIGAHGNNTYLKSGMQEASALFGNDGTGGGALTVVLRHDYNEHWMYTAGFGIHSFGQQFSIARNYSLKQPEGRFNTVKTEFTAVEWPLMIHYKLNANCRNVRWVIGAGWVPGVVGQQNPSMSSDMGNEGATNADYLTAETTVSTGAISMVRFLLSREKELKRGSIISASFILNVSAREMSETTVNYRIEQKEYEHTFGQNGSYAGIRLSYFLRPFGKK